MEYLSFFDDFDKIVVQDKLAFFLGVNDTGIIEFNYIDIVKVSGHSCGTVAGAYIIALNGLKELYKDDLPQRGEIKVEIKKLPREDNAGVVGSVLSNITGASTDFGFGGIPGGMFNRRDTLFYGADIEEDVRLTRLDTGESVGINYRPKKVVNPMAILMSAIGENATKEDQDSFATRFQNMVKTLFENQDKVIEIVK